MSKALQVSPELKPCPFCGGLRKPGDPEDRILIIARNGFNGPQCQRCGASIMDVDLQKAVDRWNQRVTTTDAVRGEVKKDPMEYLTVTGDSSVSFFKPNRNITIQGNGSEPLLSIDLDTGIVTTSDSVTATEAARIFVEEIKRLVSQDPRDTLIEAQREYIEFLGNFGGYLQIEDGDRMRQDELVNKIQAAEKAIKGG